MAIIKKYNAEENRWEILASDSASAIYSSNSTLLEDDNESSISVEDALVRDREDIEKMKKNISWLALHGGNGSGGGGGMVEVTNTIEILDENNNIISTDTIWRKTSKTLRYRISSSKASNKFDVTISLDGAVIRKDFGIAQGDSRQINIENINRYSKNNIHTFAVSAVGIYDDSVRKSVSLNQVNLTLGKTTNNYTTSSIEIDNNGTLSIRCNSSIPDDYVLYWGDSIDIFNDPAANSYGFQQVRIDNSFDVTLAIPYWNDIAYSHLLKNKLVSVGQTLTFYFILVNTNDFTIKSEMLEINVTVISPDRIAITPISLSSNKNAPTKISKASILNSNFIAYLKTESAQFTYNVAAYKVEWNENTSDWDIIEEHQGYIGEGIGQYEVAINVTYNALPNDPFFDGGNTYMLIISAYDSFVPSNTNTARCYMEIQSAVNTQIPINADGYKVFDFKVWGSDRPDANWVWTSINNNYTRAGNAEPHTVTTTANFVNTGGKSEIGSAYARLTNKAHMIINNSKLDGNNISWFPASGNESTTGLIPSANPQFTLSICFYNDFTPDDNRTIFNYGNYHPKTATEHQYGRGILINNHDIYVNIGGELTTCKIQDSIYHEIDFVFGRNSSGNIGTTMLEIYHNGILLAVNKKVRSAAVFSDFYGIDEMTLACNKQNSTLSQFTNINLQAISLYSIALNPLQIVCNYINHLVTYELDNNNLNTQLLTEKLESNLITIGDNGKISCPLWTFNSQGGMLNDFDDSNWVIIDANNGIIPKQDLLNICPIPIVILDFSVGNNQLWTWENFSTEWSPSTKLEDTTAKMYYYAAHNGTSVLSDSNGNGIMVNVGGQGTTSITYAIKNLDIDFGDSYLFWAKQSWFPEKVYTLKADVVDSAHANNATIGKFINTCAENTSLLEFTPPMQYFHNNKNTQVFEDLPDAAKDATNGVSIKHTLEGFPVLLIAKFCSDNPSQADVKSLGIYSFNLGRDAYYNLGYQILKRFKFPNGNVVTSDTIAPCLLGAPNLAEDIIDFEAQSWEGHDSINCTKKTENTANEINASSGGIGYIGSVNEGAPVELNGYFWSSKINHINHFWDLRYPKTGSITAQNGFQDLCKYLVKMPYDKGDFIIRDGAVYEYDWDINRDEMYVPEQLTGVLSIDRQNLGSPLINVPNAVFYYVICMMFGLVDSLGKNLNMRIWKNTHINNLGSYWFTCFYDMDTALGIDNFGQQVVDPDVIDEKLVNEPNLNRKFLTEQEYDDTSKIYTVFNNKLWGILDERTFKDQLQGIGGGTEARNSLYASAWNVLRSNYLRSVDEFMDTYFGKQTEGVGEMLYNQDFNVKYINTEQFGFMYGDRKAFVRDWMRKRIAFLDSYFGYLQSAGGGASSYLIASGIKDCSYQNKIKITHNSATEYLPIVSVSPCIVTSTVGGDAGVPSYYYLPANQAINVRMANAGGGGNIQTVINNSDLFLEIKDLADLGVRSISTTRAGSVTSAGGSGPEIYKDQLGSLSSFSTFDISGNTAFIDRGIDFIKLFKTWNNGDKTLPYALTSLNMSGTANSNVRNFPLNLQDDNIGPNGETYYQNPFENLTDIDITNSCITAVRLPANIALYSLKLSGSAISEIDLTGQTILEEVNFRNCSVLTSVTLNNCTSIKRLELPSLPLLRSVVVTNCPAIEEISINMNNSNNELHVSIDNVPGLKKFTLLHAYNPNCNVYINATALEELSLEDCQFNSITLNSGSKHTLKSLNLKDSDVGTINWSGENTPVDVLDLEQCEYLVNGGLNISNNAAIIKIQLPNIENDPVPLNFDFSGCINLTRIYGHILLNKAGMFRNCTKFTIHGGKFRVGNTDYNTFENETQKRLQDVGGTDPNCFDDVFQQGSGVTNITVSDSLTSLASTFENTACDAFDAYYILWHINNVTDLSYMFRNCKNIKMRLYTNINNSPHWTMFSKCGNVTTIEGIFYECDLGMFLVYEKDSSHDGLFSPLENCSNFSRALSGTYSCGENVFLTHSGNYFANGAAININEFNPQLIINNAIYGSSYGGGQRLLYVDPRHIQDIGFNLTINFSNIAELVPNLNGFCYETNGIKLSNFRLPAGVKTVTNFLRSMRGYAGTISSIGDLFTEPDKVESISYSLNINSIYPGNITLSISDNTLDGLTSLKSISNSFSMPKQIVGSNFPYHLLDSCAGTLTTFSDFFYNTTMPEAMDVIEIPGTLFDTCTKLVDVSRCFRNLQFDFKLTPDGFLHTKVENVSGLFSMSNRLIGAIPSRLFNMGLNNQPISITGTTQENDVMDLSGYQNVTSDTNSVTVVETIPDETLTTTVYNGVTYDNGLMTYTPMSKKTVLVQPWTINSVGYSYWGTGVAETSYIKPFEEWTTSTETFTIKKPVKRIKNMSGCFASCNIQEYSLPLDWTLENADSDIETNPYFCPFKYVYANGVWSQGGDNNQRYTYMWVYDGDPVHKPTVNVDQYYLPDELVYNRSRDGVKTASFNFCCAPDLLRWCTSSCNITSLFSGSGNRNNPSSQSDPGLHGRIPPYLLMPVGDITSISGMFSGCDTLSSYNEQENGAYYLIPKSFFDYTPLITDLSSSFAWCIFISGNSLQTFLKLKGWLNVSYMFGNCIWYGGDANNRFSLSGVFTNNKIENARGAFIQGAENEPRSSAAKRDQYVAFDNIFSTDPSKHNFDKDYFVFYGYDKNTVQHESPPTTAFNSNGYIASRKNYANYND